MADSLLAIGTTFELFGVDPNWAEEIPAQYGLTRQIIQNIGTTGRMESLTDVVPVMLELGFLFMDKQEEFEFLEFFIARKGRYNRFWLRHPAAAFILTATATSGTATLTCARNDFDLIHQGHERIYILMNDGDILTRQVVSCSSSGTETYLGLSDNVDRDITTTNHIRIGRLLLGRFDNDIAKFSFKASSVSTVTISFFELPEEWGSSSSSSVSSSSSSQSFSSSSQSSSSSSYWSSSSSSLSSSSVSSSSSSRSSETYPV